jgi:type I restriction enzyme, S subunit
MGWQKVSLGEILTESKIPSENPDPNKRIRVKLHIGGVEKRPLEAEKKGATKQYFRKAGQFIFGKQNFHKGAFGVISPELDGFETSADIPSFDVRKDCLPEWVFYYFKLGNRYLELEQLARGVGSQRIHPKQIYDIKIPLPPIEKQRDLIGDLLNKESRFTNIKDEQSHQLSLLKRLRQQILQDAVMGKLVEQDADNEPASVLLERITEEKQKLIIEGKIKKSKLLPEITEKDKLFDIPASWKWCRANDITSLITDGKHGDCKNEDNSGYYFLSAKDLQNGSFIYENARQITFNDFQETHRRTNLEAGDVCVVNTGATIGKTVVAKENDLTNQTTFQKSVAVIKTIRPFIYNRYIEILIKNQTPTLLKTSRGSAINNLLLSDMRLMLIPLPPLNEQHRIVAKVEQLLKICDDLEQSMQQNQNYTQELLQVALKEALEPSK